MQGKVELSGVNTSKLKVLKNDEINELLVRCKQGDEKAREELIAGNLQLCIRDRYRQEMLDGILDFEVARGNWAYTYHSRMAEQFDFILQELRRNPDSRRAVIDIRDWRVDCFKDSPACLQHIQYFIRGGKLHCKVLFRSNDACKASYMNAFALIMLQNRFAEKLGLPIGSYTHRANSYHVYAKDYPVLEGYVNRIQSGSPVTYDYEGNWKELMDSEVESIRASVEELKTR